MTAIMNDQKIFIFDLCLNILYIYFVSTFYLFI